MGQIAQMLHDQEVSVIFAVENNRLDTYRVRSTFDLGVSWFIVYITIIQVLIHNIILQYSFAEFKSVDKHSIESKCGKTGRKCHQHPESH